MSYAPYAQLAKMLVPSSGSIAIYDVDGELVWCSDGYERPDLRELVEALMSQSPHQSSNQGTVRRTSTGINAFACNLQNERDESLGFVLIELGAGQTAQTSSSMAASLLRPVLECLASRLNLERVAHDATIVPTGDLDFLMGINEVEAVGPEALQDLMTRCADNLGCVSAAFLVPDKDISVVATRQAGVAKDCLDRTQKHLLAWAQLNNRPMIVNRVGDQPNTAPYKILSCPVRADGNQVAGIMALFRPADGPNFDLRDARMLEFLSRKALSILNGQHDQLTGLMSRPVFEQRLETSLQQDSDGEKGVLLYIDIDRLNAINDAFGLLAGDEAIQRLAEMIRRSMGVNDFACRIAGDRFAIYLPTQNETEATTVVSALLESMSQLGYMQDADAVPVSVSIGVASRQPLKNDGRHLIALAELACKHAQKEGGNQFSVYTHSEKISPRRERELFAVASLQQALQANDFRLYAQPLVQLDAGTDQAVGFEVLIRMRDPSGSLVSPNKFLDAARRYKLMPAMDRWVFSAAVRELKNHRDLRELPLGIAINVSEQSLASHDYCAAVVDELKAAGLPGSMFCFEINEAAAVNRSDDAERFIASVREAGCKVALDDFGRGFTSLTNLRRLKVDFLKIDGGLIRRVLDDLHMESMVLGLAKAAESLGLKTVAEHVESQILAAKLRAIGIDYAQGYCYGQPKPLPRALAEVSGSLSMLQANQS